MRCFLEPLFGFSSALAGFDEAGPMAAIVYKVARNSFKPYIFVHFRTVDGQAQDAPTLGTGGRESIEGASDWLTVIGQTCTIGWEMRPQTGHYVGAESG